jgi:hypothetical protein
MNTLAIKNDFFTSVRQLLRWLSPSPGHSTVLATATRPAERRCATKFIATRADAILPASIKSLQSKPLRVVRVVENGQPRSDVGRMVISGRMADVCAELDRLAACEAI